MYLKKKYKIWGSWFCGLFVFGCSLVLTPRIWIDSSASPSVPQIPIQSIQPFDTTPYHCTNCTPGSPKPTPCLTDRMPEHPIIWNNSDQLLDDDYADCDLNSLHKFKNHDNLPPNTRF